MATLVAILALAVFAACGRPEATQSAAPASPSDALEMFARGIDLYLGTRRGADGMVFSPPVADVFRARIEVAMRGRDVGPWLDNETDHDEDDPDPPAVTANQRYPTGATQGFPTRLLWSLPALPEPLEYRILGRQLVILDVDVERVVDVLPHAFTEHLETPP